MPGDAESAFSFKASDPVHEFLLNDRFPMEAPTEIQKKARSSEPFTRFTCRKYRSGGLHRFEWEVSGVALESAEYFRNRHDGFNDTPERALCPA